MKSLWPEHIIRYYRSTPPQTGRAPHSILASSIMLILITAQSVTGLFSLDDETDVTGPFYSLVSGSVNDLLTGLHNQLSDLLLLLIIVHIGAINFYYFVKKDLCIENMFIVKPTETGAWHGQLGNIITATALACIVFIGIESDIIVHLLHLTLN